MEGKTSADAGSGARRRLDHESMPWQA